MLEDPDNELLLSAASAWEIAIKYALGRLPLPLPPADYVSSRMSTSGTTALAVAHRHATHVATLPHHHRDPCDRLLIAQSQLEGATLMTADRTLQRYAVALIRT